MVPQFHISNIFLMVKEVMYCRDFQKKCIANTRYICIYMYYNLLLLLYRAHSIKWRCSWSYCLDSNTHFVTWQNTVIKSNSTFTFIFLPHPACDCESVWYDLPGALQPGLEACLQVLVQWAPGGAQERADSYPSPLRLAGRDLHRLRPQELQGQSPSI